MPGSPWKPTTFLQRTCDGVSAFCPNSAILQRFTIFLFIAYLASYYYHRLAFCLAVANLQFPAGPRLHDVRVIFFSFSNVTHTFSGLLRIICNLKNCRMARRSLDDLFLAQKRQVEAAKQASKKGQGQAQGNSCGQYCHDLKSSEFHKKHCKGVPSDKQMVCVCVCVCSVLCSFWKLNSVPPLLPRRAILHHAVRACRRQLNSWARRLRCSPPAQPSRFLLRPAAPHNVTAALAA